MLTKARRTIKIGPANHGQRMSLADYEFARPQEGNHYELARGFITVSEVANFYHACVVALIRDFLGAYRLARPDIIKLILDGMECKLLIPEWESERHPDIAVYLTMPKGPKNHTLWRTWIPELVVEVVSERSTDRDYVDKRQEYWTLGVKEYWIVDTKRQHVVALRRGKSDWLEKRLGGDGVCTSKLLPGFKLACAAIFAAAAGESDE